MCIADYREPSEIWDSNGSKGADHGLLSCDSKDGGNMFLWDIGIHLEGHMAPRRLQTTMLQYVSCDNWVFSDQSPNNSGKIWSW
jgi:hypothetical protein